MSFSSIFGGGGGNEDRFKAGLEDAHRKGATSPAGVFSLLGDLDYYALIEKLIRGSITEQQLTTPIRWWLFFKGSAFASLVCTILVFIRFGLLVPNAAVSVDLKYLVYLVVYTAVIYRIALIFPNYVRYSSGVTWIAARNTLQGFTAGVIAAEVFKLSGMFATQFLRPTILEHLYGRSPIIDEIATMYFDLFLGPPYSEIAELALCSLAIYYGNERFRLLTEKLKETENAGRPYDLLTAND